MADLALTIGATTDNNQTWAGTASDALSAIKLTINNEDTAGDTNTGIVATKITNQKGSSLPSTGGIGTTMFYVGGGVLVATQDLNDFFSLEDGKYGRGILNNCKIKIILNLEEEEAQRVQSVLKLTDAEIDNITRFERGSALIVTNSNNVTVDMRCSEEEKDLITTDRDELRRIVERKMQNQTETEES